MHRSNKKTNILAVDKWTTDCAAAGKPVAFEIILAIKGEFALCACSIEELIIARLRRQGCQLLNCDVPAIKRRKKPSRGINYLVKQVIITQP